MRLPIQAKVMLTIVSLVVVGLVIGGGVLITRQATLQAEVDILSAQVVTYIPNPIPVKSVTDRGVVIDGSTCFRDGVTDAYTQSTEFWSFRGERPEGDWLGFYENADSAFVFGDRGIPLDSNNCLVYNDFTQPMPRALIEDLAANPDVPVTMIFTISTVGTDVTDPENPVSGRGTVLTSQPFTIPPRTTEGG